MVKHKDKVIVQALALLAAFIGQFISEGVMLSFPVLYPDLANYFKASNAEISLVGSLTYGCWFLIGPISGKLVDRYGPVVVLMVSGLVGAIGCLLTTLSTRLWHVMVTFGIIFGTCCGLAFIPAITVVGSYFKKHHHLATTACTVGGAVGGVVYPLCMQAILHHYPWQFCYAATAYVMLQVVACGAVFYLKPDRASDKIRNQAEKDLGSTDIDHQYRLNNCQDIAKDHYDHHSAIDDDQQHNRDRHGHRDQHSPLVLRVPSIELPSSHLSTSKSKNGPQFPHWRRNLIIFAIHNFFWNFGDFGFVTVLPLFLSHNGFSTDEIAYVISITMFTTIIGRLAAAAFCAWPRGDRILIYNLSTVLSGVFLMLFCGPVNLLLYFVWSGAYGFMFGVQTALVPSVTIDLVGHDRTNMALGVAIFASGLAGLSSPFAAGLLTDFRGDYYMTFQITSALVMICFIFMTHLHWPLNRVNLKFRRN